MSIDREGLRLSWKGALVLLGAAGLCWWSVTTVRNEGPFVPAVWLFWSAFSVYAVYGTMAWQLSHAMSLSSPRRWPAVIAIFSAIISVIMLMVSLLRQT